MDGSAARVGDPRLEARLKAALKGEVRFDRFTRGRYSTDASIYQIEPLGVVIARDAEDIATALEIAREEGVPVLPRGGGTAQCGQTVNRALVVDCSKYMTGVGAVDRETRRVRVEPGVVVERLNKRLRADGLFFPVDISTGSRATIGGMTANNSCGARSLRYGNMVHNVRAVDAILADGTTARFGEVAGNFDEATGPERYRDLVRAMRALHREEADEIEARFPKLLRRVGGYNIDMIADGGHNMAHLLVGSEGTLGFFTGIELDLQPIPPHRVLGICHFPSFYRAMAATKAIVALGPSAVELVDRTMIDLARAIDMFRPTVERFVEGAPEALLLVEFAGEDKAKNERDLERLVELMGDLGFPDAVVRATDNAFQSAVWEVRAHGLNIMMSMKGEGKPISFIEDCAVPLDDLAEYTRRLDEVFKTHGTYGTWYAHASVGTLHVRPVLNLKQELGVKAMRAIAEEAFAIVREYKGSHSGEHGDGIVRSEFHEPMFGSRLVRAFERVKDTFDPGGLFNPGKIVRPPKMDDRSIMRYRPGYAIEERTWALDWSDWGGFGGAVEMCNNNGACRKTDPGVMCPSYRATFDEQHVTRGRANTLRLALSGQLGAGAFTSPAMRETMELCIGCKGCKRECPVGVDMARMKIEFLHHYRKEHPLTLRERLVAYLPRYAPWAARVRGALNLRNAIPPLAALSERVAGFAAKRSLPAWRKPWQPTGRGSGHPVALFADTFNRYFEPENLEAAERVLARSGYDVTELKSEDGRPLCCGRTFLAMGLVEEARTEARRLAAAMAPLVVRGVPIVGLEPSCVLTQRDEHKALLPGATQGELLLFEEFLAAEAEAGRFAPKLGTLASKAVLHTHCHQKAFGVGDASIAALKLVPGLAVETFDSTCCGMAGAFGYEAEHYETSLAIGELSVLPKLRTAGAGDILIAPGTSCRHQIRDALGRAALHPARVLDRALEEEPR